MANESNSEKNPFIAIMAKKTEAELAKILSVDKGQYTEEALNAAQEEYAKRDIKEELKEELLVKTIEDREEEKEKIKTTSEMVVGKGLRLLHFIVDTLLIYGIAIVSFVVAAYFNIEFESNEFLDQILFAVFMVCYYLGFESQLYTTPAKMLTQCTVVMENGEKPSFEVIAKRSLCRLIPFEVFSFLGAGSGWHDVLSKTKVIRIK